jgi:hypothetical protein
VAVGGDPPTWGLLDLAYALPPLMELQLTTAEERVDRRSAVVELVHEETTTHRPISSARRPPPTSGAHGG